MDVIITDTARIDVGAITDATLDFDFGVDDTTKNDFTLQFPAAAEFSKLVGANSLVYIDGTEYGGIITSQKSSLASRESSVTWSGLTLQGKLNKKVLSPDSGQDYLKVSGAVNTVLQSLLERVGLTSLFHVSDDCTTKSVSYQFERYVPAYTGITKMLAASGLKLHANCNQNGFFLSALPIESVEDVDSDMLDFDSTQDHGSINHLIGLGEGELKARAVSHWYADKDGNVSQTQSLKGLDEIAAVYDYSNAKLEDLAKETEKKLKELQTKGSVSVTIRDTTRMFDIGDLVTAKDMVTGIQVSATINRKTVKLDSGYLSIKYSVGETSSTTTSLSGSAEATIGGGHTYSAGNGVSIDNYVISTEVTKTDLDAVTTTAAQANKTASDMSSEFGATQKTVAEHTTLIQTAQTTAETADGKAVKAQASADTAKSTADTAVTNAAKAQSAADKNTTAIQSLTTADAALTKRVSTVETGLKTVESKADKAQESIDDYSPPVATATAVGVVKPDGKTITISNGTLTAHGDSEAAGFLATHPIGCVYETTSPTNPGTTYGGTWKQLPSLSAFTWERTA